MHDGRKAGHRSFIIVVSLIAAVAAIAWSGESAWSQARSTSKAESLAAWEKIAMVLQHPRCLNCHQLNSPLQGDKPRPHVPRVVRGPENDGVTAMRCGNCHNEMGNNPSSGVPGAPHWALAPASMRWQGLSGGRLCRGLKDPALNGNRSPQALLEHVEKDPLVLWGWNPGEGRAPVPIAYDEFVGLMKIWIAGGSVCPS